MIMWRPTSNVRKYITITCKLFTAADRYIYKERNYNYET